SESSMTNDACSEPCFANFHESSGAPLTAAPSAGESGATTGATRSALIVCQSKPTVSPVASSASSFQRWVFPSSSAAGTETLVSPGLMVEDQSSQLTFTDFALSWPSEYHRRTS